MYKQEYKIEYDGNEVFFFQHSLKSAYEHARDSFERKKEKYNEIKLFRLNESSFGERWILVEAYRKEN